MPNNLPLEKNELIRKLEEVNKERFNDEDWEFNNSQEDAIRHDEGPLWTIAGPGSGKTEVLVNRVVKLLLVDQINPSSILVTTFTKKASENLEERILMRLQDLGYEQISASKLRVGTIHSLCNDIMREFRYSDHSLSEQLGETGQKLFIHDDNSLVDYLKDNIDLDNWDCISESDVPEEPWKDFLPAFGWERRFVQNNPPNYWLATKVATKLLNRVSQYDVEIDDLLSSSETHLRVLGESYRNYITGLGDSYTDYARILEDFIDFIDDEASNRFLEEHENGLKHILVDEYQDTNPLQEKLYLKLAEQTADFNLTVVGDDDQALYRFRGGTVECLIRFKEKVEENYPVSVNVVRMMKNYRSQKDIIDWCNRYLTNYPTMQEPDARASNKSELLYGRSDLEDSPRVRAILTDDSINTYDQAAELVERMDDSGYIQDLSQVAFLFHSASENNVGDYVDALNHRGIRTYNPRNKSLLDRDEIRLALGTLIVCLDPDQKALDTSWINRSLTGDAEDAIDDWRGHFRTFQAQNPDSELVNFVQNFHEKLENSSGSLSMTFQDLFFKITSLPPFIDWIETSNENGNQLLGTTIGERLAKLTDLIESFSRMSDSSELSRSGSLSGTVSRSVMSSFYDDFCGYLASTRLDDPEDEYDQIPADHVQIMTVHQAKGLEFPVVFVGSIDEDAQTNSGVHWLEDELEDYANIDPSGNTTTRATRDKIREFYVAYSRAKEDLILVGNEGDDCDVSLGFDSNEDPLTTDWFSDARLIESPDEFPGLESKTVGEPDSPSLKRRYSVTADVQTYEKCKRRYGYFNEIGFVPSFTPTWMFGRLIHETLDKAHRHYRGELEGVGGGEIPTDEELETYFEDVRKTLLSQNAYPFKKIDTEECLNYLKRFHNREKNTLYPRIIETEMKLKTDMSTTDDSDFILEGIVDVLKGNNNEGIEIWDYKATQRPDPDQELQIERYRQQLFTYANLYRKKEGDYPDRALIYFLGEEERESAILDIDCTPENIEGHMDEFRETVSKIESTRETRSWFNLSVEDLPPDRICENCEIRWSCEARPEFSLV